MTNHNELVIIDPKSSSVPVINPDCSLLSLINALNPIGIIGKSLVEIMAYRTEIKRLRFEEIKVKENSKVAQAYITAQAKAKMQQIENQKIALLKGLDFAERNLYESRVTRNALIRCLDNANNAMKKLISCRELPSEEIFLVFGGVISEISGRLVEFERNNIEQASFVNEHLLKIVGDAKHDLLLPPSL
jgi:hypothetical protein